MLQKIVVCVVIKINCSSECAGSGSDWLIFPMLAADPHSVACLVTQYQDVHDHFGHSLHPIVSKLDSFVAGIWDKAGFTSDCNAWYYD